MSYTRTIQPDGSIVLEGEEPGLGLGSALQVLRTNAGATALEFGSATSIVYVGEKTGGNQTITAATETTVEWDTDKVAPVAGHVSHSNSSAKGNITLLIAGKYKIHARTVLQAVPSGTQMLSRMYSNSTQIAEARNQIFDLASNSGPHYLDCVWLQSFAANDVINIRHFRASGDHTIWGSSTGYTFVAIEYLGA